MGRELQNRIEHLEREVARLRAALGESIVRIRGGVPRGGGGGNVGIYVIESIEDDEMRAREFNGSTLAAPKVVEPLPGREVSDYDIDALKWGSGDTLDNTVVPCLGIEILGKVYMMPMLTPSGDSLPQDADYGI